jgi:hypothetical protein
MDELENELLDFFAGRGRFAAREDYVGMSASTIPKLFAAYFESLDTTHERHMVNLLTDIALAKRTEHAEHIPEATHLLLDLALRGFTEAFGDARATLEQDLAAHLTQWTAARDQAPLPSAQDYRRDWHFGLQLWGVLYLLSSPAAELAYRELTEQATSPRFRDALQQARALYDSRG